MTFLQDQLRQLRGLFFRRLFRFTFLYIFLLFACLSLPFLFGLLLLLKFLFFRLFLGLKSFFHLLKHHLFVFEGEVKHVFFGCRHGALSHLEDTFDLFDFKRENVDCLLFGGVAIAKKTPTTQAKVPLRLSWTALGAGAPCYCLTFDDLILFFVVFLGQITGLGHIDNRLAGPFSQEGNGKFQGI